MQQALPAGIISFLVYLPIPLSPIPIISITFKTGLPVFPFRWWDPISGTPTSRRISTLLRTTGIPSGLVQRHLPSVLQWSGISKAEEAMMVVNFSDLWDFSGMEYGLYFSDDIDLSKKLAINGGLRLSGFR